MLYSVLCRYHIRCGEPNARQTNLALWGKTYGKKLFLPDGIESIAAQMPPETGLTAERFIADTTIFPLLKPFATLEKIDALTRAMKYGDPNIYNILSFSRVFTLQHRKLRYCTQCVASDANIFGESYWHRVHQLPGVYICPIHNAATADSAIEAGELRSDYYPLLNAVNENGQSYTADHSEKLSDFARDTAWLLNNGCELGYLDNTNGLYDSWLRVKGYRDGDGKTSVKSLARDVPEYYGRDFLMLFDAYNSGACTWISRVIQHRSFQHPLYHLLLMRVLAGSPEQFFAGTQAEESDRLPYGRPSYPCRNRLCEYHLLDVIGNIEVVNVKGNYRATFVCPHCGFTYRRKTPLAKEMQYDGQIDIVEYGRVWEQIVARRLLTNESPYAVAKTVHCDVRTILKFGVDRGLLPAEQLIKRKEYVPAEFPQKKPTLSEQRDHYRQRWLDVISANPTAIRTELRRLDCKADQWLHLHDAEWLIQNSPPSKRGLPKWADCDDEYLERTEDSVKQIRDSLDLPQRVSLASIGRKAGIPKPQVRLASNFLPKTRAFVAANVETHEQWQKRKIQWSVRQMRERGEILTIYKVRHASCIEDRERRLDDFILECIEHSE
jgi:hypothetical protein